MRLPPHIKAPAVCAAVVAGLIGALSLIQAARPAPLNDMAAVEQLLTAHGLPVEGFAQTTPVDLEALDTMAPAECAQILRRAYLAKLAVIRMAPERAADANGIARAVRFTLAQDAGAAGCAL